MSEQQQQPKKRRRTGTVINLPNGKTLKPRHDFARENLGGISDKTAKRMNFPTTYIGGVAHVDVQASLNIVADSVQRRNQPPQRRGRTR